MRRATMLAGVGEDFLIISFARLASYYHRRPGNSCPRDGCESQSHRMSYPGARTLSRRSRADEA
jgi:hypothetical protein